MEQPPPTDPEPPVRSDTETGPVFPQQGFKIGEYTILDMLGHGSMSTVFRASDGTGHQVALKVIRESPDVSETLIERFRREIEASKKLRIHPHIVTTYGAGQSGEFHYIAMQLVEGEQTLESLIRDNAVPLPEAVGLVCKIARALDFAHQQRILHRDVKPTNVLMNQFGEPLLSDFGVAALMEWPTFTLEGALTGTPLYMSPEQSRGEPLTPASDLYGLAVILFELVTGVLPYRAPRYASVPETLRAVQQESPRRPRVFRSSISRDLEAVMLRALAKQADHRYHSGEALAIDLENALQGRPVDAQRYSWVHRAEHVAWQYRRSIAIGTLIVAVSLAITAWFAGQLNTVHYQNVIGFARLRNSQAAVVRLSRDNQLTSTGAPTRQERRIAQRRMQAGLWQEALDILQPVVEQSLDTKDLRSAALAQLDQARCSIMLGEDIQALNLYYDVLHNPDAPPRVQGLAASEWAILTRLRNPEQDLAPLLGDYTIDATNPLRIPLLCLLDQGSPKDLMERFHTLPASLQNDACLAAAVMTRWSGDPKAGTELLRQCLNTSHPSSEWPGPYARKLRKDWGK